ncbi:hypothetical protein [Lactobacillus mulieris]|uniref:hypothetical protein n=1 Tax=Lactobacillus mulieris TaxID=2508708 RepID=UPI00084EA9AB|nr:hypothetical protein [Lactobacillus mulieris]OEH66119.1 hypothetical protein BFX48_01995 [Lactobacillus jensenii]
MINRTIKVTYVVNRETKEAKLNYLDFGENWLNYEYGEVTVTFTKFTNKGKVSKTEASHHEFVNAEAERLLAEKLQIEADREEDQKRANEIAKIINAIDYEQIPLEEFVSIKTKQSHSKWYNTLAGSRSLPSVYDYMVPKSVEDLVLELRIIRKKHQNDWKFNFFDCDYPKLVRRYADHENGTPEISIELH